MKLIIDIPEEVYKKAKETHDVMCDSVWLGIKYGTPLEESEDCVSRQAVLEIIEKCHCEEWVKADIGAPIEALQPVIPAEKEG